MAEATVVFIQDEYRVVYRVGSLVYKKRRVGLEYEGMVGIYINSFNDPRYVRTVAFERRPSGDRLTTEYISGLTWHQTFKNSTSYPETQALTLRILDMVKELPFTHYDLHMNNVIVQEDGVIRIIDLGFASIPSKEWTPDIKYIECSYPSLSCGILPSVLDPGYDLMLIVLSMFKQAKKFGDQRIGQFCMETIKNAEFDHPLFYGYEHFISLEVLNRYRNLFYPDKMPLLIPSNRSITYSELISGLEDLKLISILWLRRIHSCTETEAIVLFSDPTTNHLLPWLQTHESRVYELVYAYKRHRIQHRQIPSLETVREHLTKSTT
jgi:hypothetical protein